MNEIQMLWKHNDFVLTQQTQQLSEIFPRARVSMFVRERKISDWKCQKQFAGKFSRAKQAEKWNEYFVFLSHFSELEYRTLRVKSALMLLRNMFYILFIVSSIVSRMLWHFILSLPKTLSDPGKKSTGMLSIHFQQHSILNKSVADANIEMSIYFAIYHSWKYLAPQMCVSLFFNLNGKTQCVVVGFHRRPFWFRTISLRRNK